MVIINIIKSVWSGVIRILYPHWLLKYSVDKSTWRSSPTKNDLQDLEKICIQKIEKSRF